MSDNSSGSELRRTWESAAPGWAKWEHVFATSLADATDTMIDRAGIQPGMRVLDLACGAGSQTLRVAQRVGPNGTVVAADISGAMLEHVRQNALGRDLHNIETLESSAEDLSQPSGSFDAAICRLALMLFQSPRQALHAVRQALKPGGRFAALVFSRPAGNQVMAKPMGILLHHAGTPAPEPGQPGLFALAGDDVLERLMADCGFGGVKTEVVQAAIELPSAADALKLLQEAGGAYRAVAARLSDADKARAWSEVHQCLRQFEAGGRFHAGLELIIASGATPR